MYYFGDAIALSFAQAMFLRIYFLLLPSFGFMVLTTPFQPVKDDTLELLANPNVTVLPSNASLNTSRFRVVCDGETYGYNPNIRDCEQAKEDWAPDAKVWTLGERRTGLPPDTVPLPYRVIGPRGLCYIQPTLIGDHRTGKASINMIRRAAAAIILQCIATAGSQGGIATGIGKSKVIIVAERSLAGPHNDLHPLVDIYRWRQQCGCINGSV